MNTDLLTYDSRDMRYHCAAFSVDADVIAEALNNFAMSMFSKHYDELSDEQRVIAEDSILSPSTWTEDMEGVEVKK